MNSVILHFQISKQQVMNVASSVGIINEIFSLESGEKFWFRDYEDYENEYDDDEKKIIEAMLGIKPVSSFELLCGTASGQLALKKIIEIFAVSNGVLDDDNDGYWRLADLESAYKLSKEPSVFNIVNYKN